MEVSPSTLRFFQYYTMILQRPRIILRDAGFEPAIPLPQKSGALPMGHHIFNLYHNHYSITKRKANQTSGAAAVAVYSRWQSWASYNVLTRQRDNMSEFQ